MFFPKVFSENQKWTFLKMSKKNPQKSPKIPMLLKNALKSVFYKRHVTFKSVFLESIFTFYKKG
jgi:hypothetical protein